LRNAGEVMISKNEPLGVGEARKINQVRALVQQSTKIKRAYQQLIDCYFEQ